MPTTKTKGLAKAAQEDPSPLLFKTELCKFWKSGCRYENSCPFAHGSRELQLRPDLTKTSLCQRYEQGHCANADVCRFAHGISELREMSNDVCCDPTPQTSLATTLSLLGRPIAEEDFGTDTTCDEFAPRSDTTSDDFSGPRTREPSLNSGVAAFETFSTGRDNFEMARKRKAAMPKQVRKVSIDQLRSLLGRLEALPPEEDPDKFNLDEALIANLQMFINILEVAQHGGVCQSAASQEALLTELQHVRSRILSFPTAPRAPQAAKLASLQAQKQDAILRENFVEAHRLKCEITALKELGQPFSLDNAAFPASVMTISQSDPGVMPENLRAIWSDQTRTPGYQ